MEATKTVSKTNKMAKDNKKTTTAATPAPVSVTPAPVAPATPAKKTAAPKKEKKATPAKAEVVIPTTATAVATTAVVSQSSDAILASLTEKLKALSADFSAKVREAVKSTQEAARVAKKEARDSKKKRKINPADMTPEQKAAWEARRANNAFLVQRPLSDELCHFMGLASGSKRSQTEVTKFISEYVKSHKCFDPSFQRRILPNAVLAKLLRVDDKTEVTYLNLQKYLKVHFLKA